jgi:hypothetical protein
MTLAANVGSPINLGSTLYGFQVFESSGTFTPTTGVNSVQVLVVAGGGGGGMNMGGGGGGGGVVYNSNYAVTPGTPITLTIGSGGTGAAQGNNDNVMPNWRGTNGGNSVFGTITAIGGGTGGSSQNSQGVITGIAGGSGGGAGGYNDSPANPAGTYAGGAGTSGQGYAGAAGGVAYYSGGGGGAGGVGTMGALGTTPNGGPGISYAIPGFSSYYWGGGGGGAGYSQNGGNGGIGGGGGGAIGTTTGGVGWRTGAAGGGGAPGVMASMPGGGGGANTGGGGGGGSYYDTANKGGDGGSGIVIVVWPWPTQSTWTNFSSNDLKTDLVKNSFQAVEELRDKLLFLQTAKGNTTAAGLMSTAPSIVMASGNATLSTTGITNADFTATKIVDSQITQIDAELNSLATKIGTSSVTDPAVGDTILAHSNLPSGTTGTKSLTDLKIKIDTLATYDVPSKPSMHSNTASHGNHGNHASHFNHTSTGWYHMWKSIRYVSIE